MTVSAQGEHRGGTEGAQGQRGDSHLSGTPSRSVSTGLTADATGMLTRYSSTLRVLTDTTRLGI